MSTPCVLLVDDEPEMLELLAGALPPSFEVRTFQSATDALRSLEDIRPDVIVSDIVMPQIGGFEFRRRYAARFGHRGTPFLFLSSLADDDTMVAGLDAGADDYLTKPIRPELFRARIESLIRRRRYDGTASFRGDFTTTPWTRLLEFCEQKRFTGTLTVDLGAAQLTLRVHGGELDRSVPSAVIDQLWDLASGAFLLESAAPSFDELEARRPVRAPTGRLSTIPVKGRTIQIETELARGDTPTIVSLVLAGSDTVSKIRKPIPPESDPVTVQALINEQHEEAIASLNDRISTLRHRRNRDSMPSPSTERSPQIAPPPPASDAQSEPAANSSSPEPVLEEPGTDDVSLLFDEGFEHSRGGDWQKALACWEEALALEPSNRTLRINVEVARRKLSRDES